MNLFDFVSEKKNSKKTKEGDDIKHKLLIVVSRTLKMEHAKQEFSYKSTTRVKDNKIKHAHHKTIWKNAKQMKHLDELHIYWLWRVRGGHIIV